MKKFKKIAVCALSAAMIAAPLGANAACLNSCGGILNKTQLVSQLVDKVKNMNVSDSLKNIDLSELLNRISQNGCANKNDKTDCTGSDCANKNNKTDCTGSDCANKNDKTDCTGSDCANKNDKTDNNDKADNSDKNSDVALNDYAAEVVSLVNKERAKSGLSALTVDAKVQQAAQVRAQEQQTVFSHTRPDGTSCFTALKDAGVSYTAAGENIAMGQTSPAQVMQDWMNSDGHRKNIMNSSFTKIGVGFYKDANGKMYWSQMFIK